MANGQENTNAVLIVKDQEVSLKNNIVSMVAKNNILSKVILLMYMNKFLIESILGLICGLFLGITGIAPIGLLLIALDLLKIGDYKSNLGAILFLNLFPITLGSVYDFYKSKQINFTLGTVLLLTIMLGSFIGSKFVVGDKAILSTKMIKYITSFMGFIVGIVFLYSAYYEKNE